MSDPKKTRCSSIFDLQPHAAVAYALLSNCIELVGDLLAHPRPPWHPGEWHARILSYAFLNARWPRQTYYLSKLADEYLTAATCPWTTVILICQFEEGAYARFKDARGVARARERRQRLLREAKERHPPRDEDAGDASPQELQKAVDDVSAAARGRRAHAMTDAAASPPSALRPPASGLRHPASSSASLPDLILIDGGKGQLNAACTELAKLGLTGIPVIGLAKEFEEIYRPGAGGPLRWSQDTAALKLLQRVRDESHRFANTYNAQLRLKRISESMLDEFPGIGDQRKAALLKRFGSVHRLRLATAEQIAEVPGFGIKAASELKSFLEARSVTPPPPPDRQ